MHINLEKVSVSLEFVLTIAVSIGVYLKRQPKRNRPGSGTADIVALNIMPVGPPRSVASRYSVFGPCCKSPAISERCDVYCPENFPPEEKLEIASPLRKTPSLDPLMSLSSSSSPRRLSTEKNRLSVALGMCLLLQKLIAQKAVRRKRHRLVHGEI